MEARKLLQDLLKALDENYYDADEISDAQDAARKFLDESQAPANGVEDAAPAIQVHINTLSGGKFIGQADYLRSLGPVTGKINTSDAAAPQVVADERAVSAQSAFEKAAGGCIFGDASRLEAAQDWFKQGYRAAAPVQAQEPVDWQKIALFYQDLYGKEKHRAPVQPVAVPDAMEVPAPQESGPVIENEGEIAYAEGWNACRAEILKMTPAAQGDAKELTINDLHEAYYAHSGNSKIDYDGREWGNFVGGWDAAIAAKAAS